jgi:hypothetical protein
MAEKIDSLPEVFLSHRDLSTAISRAVKAGRVRKLGPRLYTSNLTDAPEAIVARHLWPIVALLMPGAVVSHRTAIENRAAPDGSVFLSSGYRRQIRLPGVILRQLEGQGPAPGDTPYMGTLHLASRPRAFLENLLPARGAEAIAKIVGRASTGHRYPCQGSPPEGRTRRLRPRRKAGVKSPTRQGACNTASSGPLCLLQAGAPRWRSERKYGTKGELRLRSSLCRSRSTCHRKSKPVLLRARKNRVFPWLST